MHQMAAVHIHESLYTRNISAILMVLIIAIGKSCTPAIGYSDEVHHDLQEADRKVDYSGRN